MEPQARPYVSRSLVAVPLAVCLACLALAALTLLTPSGPTTDPWGWIIWGREILHLHLLTAINGPPSWKPLPVVVTTPLALAGGGAPTLWMLFARAAGLVGLVIAFRLTGKLVGDHDAAARSVAGALAGLGLALSFDWMRAFWHGYSEPLAAALVLGAVDRHLAGRPRQALILGALTCGTRPEGFPIVCLYGLLLLRRREAHLAFVAATLAALPAAWLIPDWIGSGDPLNGAKVARALTTTPEDLGGALHIAPVPYALAAILATVDAARRDDRAFLEVALVAGAWAALVRVMVLAGYPPSVRFFYLPAVIVCALGAAGLVRLALAPPSHALKAVLALAALGIAAVSLGGRVLDIAHTVENSAARARSESELAQAATRAGGSRLSTCGVAETPDGLRWMQGVVAWRLGRSLAEIHTTHTLGGSLTILKLTRGSNLHVARGTVTVWLPPKPALLFLPFARMHVRFVGGPVGSRPERLGSKGSWSVYATDGPACRRLTRPVGPSPSPRVRGILGRDVAGERGDRASGL
jgi:hypothetical protein